MPTKAGFVWAAPQKVAREGARVRHAKSVNFCPAVIDHEARLYEVTCPIDLHLRFQVDEKTRQPPTRQRGGRPIDGAGEDPFPACSPRCAQGMAGSEPADAATVSHRICSWPMSRFT